MEIELQLKITRTRDDITSLSDLRIAKDHDGPLFVSREIDTMFVLLAHLKDYRRDNIDIKISEDGSRMTITGAKLVEEMMLERRLMWTKNLELRTFKKVFRVPEGVVLDKTKAKFNEEDSILTIKMPKLVRGIIGVAIEEVKEEQVDGSTQEAGNNVSPEPESSGELASKEAEQVVATETAAEEAPKEEPEPANEIGEVSDGDKRESEVTENVPEEEAESGGQKVEETSKETEEVEDLMEVEESIPEKAEEPPASIALQPKEVQSDSETQELQAEMAAPVEEPQTEEIPELKEETPEAESTAESGLLVTGVEEPHTTTEKRQLESNVGGEQEKREDSTGVEEPIKTEPDQEEQGENKDQVHEQETLQVSNETEESVNEMRFRDEEERNENVNPEVDKEIDRNQGEIQKKNNKERPKLCPPLVFAGSAILVSLIVFVISFIRSKKR